MRYYFNLSCRTTYDQKLVIGVDADSVELAEIAIDKFVDDERTHPAQELLVHETKVVSRDYDSCSLIEDTEITFDLDFDVDDDKEIDNDKDA